MRILILIAALSTAMFAGQAAAQSFRALPAVTTPITLGDDNEQPATLPFAVKIGAEAAYTGVLVNQNGYILKAGGSDQLPYFDDLEARADTGQANYGTSTVGGRPAFIITHANVGYCCAVDGRRANLQIVLIDRSDIAPGDFDVEYNTQGLFRNADASQRFIVDSSPVGRAGVGNFLAGPGSYRATWTFRSGVLISGTGPTLVAAAAPVPTLSEWAMILFGLLLAGGAALYIQRRQLNA